MSACDVFCILLCVGLTVLLLVLQIWTLILNVKYASCLTSFVWYYLIFNLICLYAYYILNKIDNDVISNITKIRIMDVVSSIFVIWGFLELFVADYNYCDINNNQCIYTYAILY